MQSQPSIRFGRERRKQAQPRPPAAREPCKEREGWSLEQQLLSRARGGDAEAQDVLFGRHRSRLYRLALRLLRSREEAEDAVQDALLSAYRNLGSFEGRSLFSTWLTRIVVNAALVHMRRQRARPELFVEDVAPEEKFWMANMLIDSRPDPEQMYGSFEARRMVEEALGELSPSIRTAFQLRELQELSNQEAAAVSGIQVGAFKSRISRARSQLATRFSPEALAPLPGTFSAPVSLPRSMARESAQSYAT